MSAKTLLDTLIAEEQRSNRVADKQSNLSSEERQDATWARLSTSISLGLPAPIDVAPPSAGDIAGPFQDPSGFENANPPDAASTLGEGTGSVQSPDPSLLPDNAAHLGADTLQNAGTQALGVKSGSTLVAGKAALSTGGSGLLGTSALVKGLSIGLVAAGALGGGVMLANRSATPPAVHTPEPRIAQPKPAARASAPSPDTTPEAVDESSSETPSTKPQRARTRAAASSPSKQKPSFESELNQIRKAQGALASGNNDKALTILKKHKKETPQGQFTEDREAVRTLALCRSGAPKAKQAAQRFLARYPDSVYVDGVRAACSAKQSGKK